MKSKKHCLKTIDVQEKRLGKPRGMNEMIKTAYDSRDLMSEIVNNYPSTRRQVQINDAQKQQKQLAQNTNSNTNKFSGDSVAKLIADQILAKKTSKSFFRK